MNIPFEYITENPVILLSLSLIASLIVWIYKDSKSNIEKNYNLKLKEIEDSLESLYDLESFISICIYQVRRNFKLVDEINLELYRKLGASQSFFSDEFRTVVIDFYNNNDYGKLGMIKSMLEAKIEELRNKKKVLLFDSDTDYTLNYIM